MLPTPIRSRPRLFGSHLPAALASGLMSVALAVGSLAVGVPAAAAAVQMPTINRTLTAGPSGLGGTTYTISGAISGTIAVSATAQFSQPIRETLTYDDAKRAWMDDKGQGSELFATIARVVKEAAGIDLRV